MGRVGCPDHDRAGSNGLDSSVDAAVASDEASGLHAVRVPGSLHLRSVAEEDGSVEIVVVCDRSASGHRGSARRKTRPTVLDLTGELRYVRVGDGIESQIGVDGKEDGGIGLGELDKLETGEREVSSASNEAETTVGRTFSGAAPPAPVL